MKSAGRKNTMLASLAAAMILSATLLASGPAQAVSSDPVAPDAPTDAPAYDASIAAAGPNDLTWTQAKSATGPQGDNTYVPLAKPNDGDATTSALAAGGVSCTIKTGNVYKRTSGSGYTYGTVGGHPATQCTVPMVRIQQSTTLYKTVWWGLQQVAGPFNSSNSGVSSLTQTSPVRICDDLRQTTFRMIVRSTGTFPTGVSGTASAYEQATLACGTR